MSEVCHVIYFYYINQNLSDVLLAADVNLELLRLLVRFCPLAWRADALSISQVLVSNFCSFSIVHLNSA